LAAAVDKNHTPINNEANLTGANLSEVFLIRANLTEADLKEANLTKARLIMANLTKANFIRANLSGADLREANLTGANLAEANLTGADLREANLTGADLRRANLTGADLTEANLTGANLSEAYLILANLTGANLARANLKGVAEASFNVSFINHSLDNYHKVTSFILSLLELKNLSLEQKKDMLGIDYQSSSSQTTFLDFLQNKIKQIQEKTETNYSHDNEIKIENIQKIIVAINKFQKIDHSFSVLSNPSYIISTSYQSVTRLFSRFFVGNQHKQ
jgi:uncharacterized protein YjbI with pentapeptide repeats